MAAKDLLSTMIDFDYWADNTLINHLLKHAKTLMDTEVDSSFSTLRKTYTHIGDAKTIWLRRMQGISLTGWPEASSPISGGDWHIHIANQLEAFKNFIENQPDTFFDSICTYRDLKGREYRQSHAQIIVHCINHSTYHRGQVITMMHQLKISEFPQTDFIVFLRKATV